MPERIEDDVTHHGEEAAQDAELLTDAHALDVVAALNAVLASEAFVSSRRSRDFLAFVVTETLAGRGDRLSERIVARRALGRPETFDGRADSAVRVQATRVRSALASYYSGPGAQEPLRIVLQPGSYRPDFLRVADVGGATDRELEDALVIVRFACSSGDACELEAAVVETLTHRLSQFSDLQVIGPMATDMGDALAIGSHVSARFVLQGSITVRQDAVRLTAFVTDALNGEVIWTAADTHPLESFASFDLLDEWSSSVAGQLGDWTGVVHRRTRTSPGRAHPSLEQAAKTAYYAYQENPTREAIETAARNLDLAMEAGADSPSILAMRGWICTAEAAHEPAPGRDDHLARAESLARAALVADSRNAQAFIVLCNAAILREQWDVCAQHARRAAELAPHHPSTLLAAATGLCLSGDWVAGPALLQECFRLNPRHPGSFHVLAAIARLLDDDDAGALAEASLIDAPGQIWGPLYRALALAGLGHVELAWQEMDVVLEVDPTFLDDPGSFFAAGMRCSEEQMAVLLKHFEPFATDPRAPSV